MFELNKIYHADCLDLMREIPDKYFDLVLTDPPYGLTKNKWDLTFDKIRFWNEIKRITVDNAAIILTSQQPFTTDLINSNRAMFGYELIWYKALGSGFLNANRMPMRNHENILIFYDELPTYNPQKYIGKMREKGRKTHDSTTNYGKHKPVTSFNNEYFPQSVIDITNGDRTKENEHPTQKPIKLFEYLIKTYSDENDTVLDCFSGSGTTAIACHNLNRQFVCIEKDKDYYEKSVKRYEEHIKQTKLNFNY